MRQKIVILDYATNITYVLDWDSQIFDSDNIEDFYSYVNEEFGICLTESSTSWMIIDKCKLIIL
jgi:hypothetical protein